MKEMITYTVTLHANGSIIYGEPREIEWVEGGREQVSRPVGSACCDWTVSGPIDGTYDVFTCDKCDEVCEVVE